jgi:transcriptional regulator with XRE-family HTH domain
MATDISIRLGQTIRELRKEKGWRQIDLAAHAELSKTHIHDLEVGRREIGLRALESIANAPELKPSQLLHKIGSQ